MVVVLRHDYSTAVFMLHHRQWTGTLRHGVSARCLKQQCLQQHLLLLLLLLLLRAAWQHRRRQGGHSISAGLRCSHKASPMVLRAWRRYAT